MNNYAASCEAREELNLQGISLAKAIHEAKQVVESGGTRLEAIRHLFPVLCSYPRATAWSLIRQNLDTTTLQAVSLHLALLREHQRSGSSPYLVRTQLLDVPAVLCCEPGTRADRSAETQTRWELRPMTPAKSRR